MSSSWCLHSLGGEGKVWHLSKGKELSVGRDPRSEIVLQSQSVENQHAIFKWDAKDVCYIVKDFGSVNGTYVNNRPVRGGSARVNHNDAIRFGYDKDHVFRMEEYFQEPSAKSKSTSGSSSSNSSSPVRRPLKVTALPPSAPTGQSNGSPLAVSPPPPVSVAVPAGIQYVVVPAALSSTAVAGQQPSSQPIPLQGQQLLSAAPPPSSVTHEEQHQHCIHHALPIPSEDHASELQESPHRSDGRRGAGVENTPALNKASKLYGQPNWWGEGQEGGATASADALQAWKREFEFVKPGSQILRQLEPSGEGGSRSRDLASSSTPPRLSSKDGLRLQAIANSRSHDTTSSWVVEFGGGGGGVATGTMPRVRRPRDRSMRPRSADPSPNRAHAASSHGGRESSPVSTTTARKSATPTPTKRHASFSTRRTTATPIKQKQQRASTPPVPISSAKTRTASPARKPPPGSPKRKAAGSILQTPPQSPSRKTKSKTPQSNPNASRSGPPNSKTGALQSQTPQSPISCPPDSSSPNHHHPLYPPPPAEATPTSVSQQEDACIDLQSLNQGTLHQLMGSEDVAGGGAEEGERTYTMVPPSSSEESLPSLSDPTSHMEKRGMATTRGSGLRDPTTTTTEEGVATEGKSPLSSRKQWNKTTDEQSADSLMMASIEARMRRLSRMAQQTARQTTALKNKIRDGQQVEVRGMDYLSLRDTSQVVTKSEEKLPEWKFFNKEANSIFRNIRVVEKWLQDIEGTLNSIRPVGQSASSEGEEGVDFASDGELYLDSVDNFESSSDPEDQSDARN